MTAPIDDRLRAATLLLAPEWLLLDDGPCPGQAVRIAAGRFTDVGPREEVIARHPGAPVVDLPETLLMPGLVDTHHHLTQSFGKALAFGEPSEIFRRIWVPLEQHLDERALHLSAKLAALEALRGGFTTVSDAGTRAAGAIDAIATATTEAGIRCVLALAGNDGGDAARWPDLRAAAERHLARSWPGGIVHPSLAISIPEAGSDRSLRETSALCEAAGVPFQVHANEHLASIERSLVARGLRPVEHLDACDALAPHTLLAHVTMLTPGEITRLRETGTAVSYNPVASAWKGNGVAQANLLAMLGIRMGLGTDGTRSDGFRLMDAAETAQRLTSGIATGDSSCGGGWTWLDMATRGGADVLALGATTGHIAAGHAADFLLLDLAVPELAPSWDLTWELVRLAAKDQVQAVFVAGRLRLWHGWPVDWDARALLRDVREVAARAVSQAPIQRIHPTASGHRTAVLRRDN